jgi:type IV pilus assembly protein PilF
VKWKLLLGSWHRFERSSILMRLFAVVLVLFLTACATTPSNKVNNVKMAEGYYMKGVSYLQKKDYELALVEFQRSIQTDKKNKDAYFALGSVSETMGKFADAERYYKEALDIDPNYPEAHNALGVVYSRQERWPDALKEFNKALENKLYTTPHVAYYNMAHVYMAQKNYEKAIEAYRDSKRFASYDQTIYELGSALFEAGKVKEAISEFREGVSISPSNAYIRYGLALALLKDNNKKAALAEFKKTVELAPKSELAQKAKDYIITLR